MDESNASAVINSLLELNQMKERLGDLGDHQGAMQALVTQVSNEACEWVGCTHYTLHEELDVWVTGMAWHNFHASCTGYVMINYILVHIS